MGSTVADEHHDLRSRHNVIAAHCRARVGSSSSDDAGHGEQCNENRGESSKRVGEDVPGSVEANTL